jgi:hypothetical protein
LSGESVQEIAAAFEQLAQPTLDELPEDFVQRWEAYAFVHGLKDRYMKEYFLIGREKPLMKALRPSSYYLQRWQRDHQRSCGI